MRRLIISVIFLIAAFILGIFAAITLPLILIDLRLVIGIGCIGITGIIGIFYISSEVRPKDMDDVETGTVQIKEG